MYAIVYDFGTSAVKTCLYDIGVSIKLMCHASAQYGLYILDNGGAEQDVDEWWEALVSSTREIFTKTDIKPSQVEGISFCTQMQGVVLVDKDGNALRHPMNYLDRRGVKEFKDGLGNGILKISGCNFFKLLRNLYINRTASVSVKDPVYKYKWVENNEPEIFSKVYKWLDVNDYLIARCTGSIIRTVDSAFSTFLYDTRKGREGWNAGLVKMYGVNPDHLPGLINSEDKAGVLSAEAAGQLGLKEGTPVFAGGGDATLTGIGAGCVEPGKTHIYMGTSGWVVTLMDKQSVDLIHSITGVKAGIKGCYHYYAELETAGKCFEWVKDHLALDEINIYSEKEHLDDGYEGRYKSLYDLLTAEISKVPAGAGGVIFTPWMHGNRSPFEDQDAAGMFFNLKLETGKRDMIRAVLEGICFHLRWLLECEDAKVKTSESIRFVGGGALSEVTCQMLADITGRSIETIDEPQNVGTIGAAVLIAIGTGMIGSPEEAGDMIPVKAVYHPDPRNKEVYEKNYRVFKRLYKSNAKSFHILNAL